MAYPYSDNMYSMVDADSDVDPIDDPLQAQTEQHSDHQDPDEQQILLSPSDGYFHTSEHTSSSSQPRDSWQPSNYTAAASSQVPHVPDVWVADPTLEQGSTAESKAREAREEQEQNRQRFNTRYPPLVEDRNLFESAAGGSTGENVSSTHSPAHTRSTSTYSPAHHGYLASQGTSSNSFNHGYHTSRYTPPSTTATPSRSRRSETLYSERSSLFSHPNEAPPAYTPSPTSPTSTASPTNYRTFSQSSMGRPEEAQGLLAHRPESMAEPVDEELYEAQPIWRERIKRRLPYFNWRNCRLLLLVLVLLLITVGFLITMFTSVKKENSKPINDPGSKQPVNDEPVNKAPDGEAPGDGGVRIKYPAFDGNIAWNNERYCSYNQIELPEEAYSLDFSAGRNITLIQDLDTRGPSEGWDVHVGGEVIIRRTGDGTPGPSVVINGIVNNDQIELNTAWDSSIQRLVISTPRKIRGDDGHKWPCLQLRVVVWVPENAELDALSVDNVHLGILLLDNLSLQVSSYAQFKSTVGKIIAATDGERDTQDLALNGAAKSFKLDSRIVEVKTTSSSIAGSWPLYDYLGVESISGSIKIGVEPKPILKDAPKPAVLYVKSTSGSIEAWEPIHRAIDTLAAQSTAQEGLATFTAADIIPPRQYGVEIKGTSGSIKGALAFSYSASAHTTSGSIALDFLPVLDKSLADVNADKPVDLETSTTSGTTVIRLLDTLWVNSDTGAVERPTAPRAPIPPTAPSAPTPPTPPTPPVPPKRTDPDHPVDFVPIGDGDPFDYIGKPVVDLDPFQAKQAAAEQSVVKSRALRCLNARHTTTSAAIALRYPASWEGDIDAQTMSGSISVKGKGVEIIRKGPDFPGIGKSILARKGKADGSLATVKTLSGSIGVKVGED